MASKLFKGRRVVYLIYGLVLFSILAYFRFPGEKFRHFVEWKINEAWPQQNCRIDKIGYSFPAGLVFSQVRFRNKANDQSPALVVDSMVVSNKFWNDYRSFLIEGQLGDGTFSGRVATFEDKSFAIYGFTAWKIANDAIVQTLINRNVTGTMQLTLDYEGNWAEPLKGKGQGELLLLDGEAEFISPLFSLDKLDFREIAMQFELKDGVVQVVSGRSEGKNLVANFSGEMAIAQPLLLSQLNFSGDTDFTTEFLTAHRRENILVQSMKRRFKTETVPFKISGLLNRPTIRFEL